MPEYPHQHIIAPANSEPLRFAGSGRGSFRRREVSRENHAQRLMFQLERIDEEFEEQARTRDAEELSPEFGMLLDVQSVPGFPLRFESLEQGRTKTKDGINLLNVRRERTDRGTVTHATIFVPYGRLDVLTRKVKAFADPEQDREKTDPDTKETTKIPKNADLLTNIDVIGPAALDALWMEEEPLPDLEEPRWWELWISRAPRAETNDLSWEQQFDREADRLGLRANASRLHFPDNVVVMIRASGNQLEGSIDLLNTLTEIRRPRYCSIDLPDLSGTEQWQWSDEALDRLDPPPPGAPAVCLLDSGVNRGHPLLGPVLAEDDMDTVVPVHGTADHPDERLAHGTRMAGLAAYGDLRDLLTAPGKWKQEHRLESVKLIHDGDEHNPPHYGYVTLEAIDRPVSHQPFRPRVYSLAITEPDRPCNGQPSSWSAAVDLAASRFRDGEHNPAIVFVSAGNHRHHISDYEYPRTNEEACIESPAQAWNAISVGALTHRSEISRDDDEANRMRPVAWAGDISPFSRTSREWDPHWPIQPDIVLEGGNAALATDGAIHAFESLFPISTASRFTVRPLAPMNGTSAATALAARLGAILQARFPSRWPETYRGLVVHSARWNDRMLDGFDPHRGGSVPRMDRILRKYGFGEPDPARLVGSGESGVTLVIEDEIQPYNPDTEPPDTSLGYFNLHDLPWPHDVFETHPEVDFTLRATLSTFVHPNPSSRCWQPTKKYRYASHLLRYSFKRSTEDPEVFRSNLEKRAEEEENEQLEIEYTEKRAPSDSKWALGPRLRGKAGSLVHDVWKGSAAELAAMDQVAIYPAKGWFATRKFFPGHSFHGSHRNRVRYSLILSIDAKQEVGLYTSIANQVGITVST